MNWAREGYGLGLVTDADGQSESMTTLASFCLIYVARAFLPLAKFRFLPLIMHAFSAADTLLSLPAGTYNYVLHQIVLGERNI